MRAFAVFLAAAFASALVHSQLLGCVLSTDCDCPRAPDRPKAQALRISVAAGFSPSDVLEVLPFDPTGGSVEIIADRVIIQYERDGMSREVSYEVAPVF